MDQQATQALNPPPSVVFGELEKFLEIDPPRDAVALCVPVTLIDKEIAKKEQRPLLRALQSLGLIDEKHVPTEAFALYIQSTPTERKEYWQRILNELYGSKVVETMANGDRAPAKAFFEGLGIAERRQQRCIAFLGKAMEKAGLRVQTARPAPPVRSRPITHLPQPSDQFVHVPLALEHGFTCVITLPAGPLSPEAALYLSGLLERFAATKD